MRKLLSLLNIIAASALLFGCGCGGEINIPIEVQNAHDLGSLQIELYYEADVIEIVEVKAEDIGENALLEFNADNPGLLVIGIADSSGINGSGSIVSISFDVLEKDSVSSLTIKNATAHDVNTLVDLPTSFTQGNFASGDVSPPIISF